MKTTSTTLLKAIGADADSPRWTEFVARYQPVMESFLARNFSSVSAEDVMQETMIVLARKLPDYHYAPDTKGHFRNYLLGILKNKAREEMKRQGRVSRADDAAKEAAAMSPSAAAPDIDGGEDGDWRIAAYEVALQQLLANPKRNERTRQIFIRIGNESVKATAIELKRLVLKDATGTSPAARTVADGEAIGGLPTPERDGYDFTGWFTAASGGPWPVTVQ